MLFELEKKDYPCVVPLLASFEKESLVVIRSVLSQATRGKVYVDTKKNPKTVLIWALYCMFYLLGKEENPSFFEGLAQALPKSLKEANEELGSTSFLVTLLGTKSLEQQMEELLFLKPYEKGFTQEFLFAGSKKEKESMSGVQVVSMEELFLRTQVDKQELLENVLEFFPDLPSFLRQGVGYAVVKDQEIVSSCFSCAVFDTWHEIVVNTYEERNRNKGYARLAAQAFLCQCEKRGLTPNWGTDSTNKASIHLAEQLGFKPQRMRPCYELSFRDL